MENISKELYIASCVLQGIEANPETDMTEREKVEYSFHLASAMLYYEEHKKWPEYKKGKLIKK